MGAREFVIVHDHNLYLRRLHFMKRQLRHATQQFAKQCLPPESADADGYSNILAYGLIAHNA